MSKPRVLVLGGGNGAFASAADLSLKGFSVSLLEIPEFASGIQAAREKGGIDLSARGTKAVQTGFAKLECVTSDASEVVPNADILLLVTPAFAQRKFAEECAPYMRPGQVVVLTPGNFGGSIEFANVLEKHGTRDGVVIAEGECMIYSGFKDSPASVWVSGYKTGMKIAAFPAKDTPTALEAMKTLYPDVEAAENVLETGLRNVNTVLHAPILILNAGWAEASEGDFLFYWDGCTPSVGRVVEAVETERMALGAALGLKLTPTQEVLVRWYANEGIKGDTLTEVLATNPVYEWDTAPKTLKHRFFLEDIPYGMVPMEDIAALAGVPTPVISSVITLASTALNTDLREDARDLQSLGMAGMSMEQVKKFVDGC